MTDLRLHVAEEGDATALLAIYAPYVLETAISFEYEPPSLDEFKARLSAIKARYPYLVARFNGRPVGYAYAHEQHERAAYQWNAELSVYLDREFTGAGLGQALYQALLDILTLQNVRNAYALVVAPNPASERLHKHFRFELAGVWHRTGYKQGRWHDVLCFEKRLVQDEGAPAPPKTIGQLDPSAVAAILERCRGLARF